MASCRFFLSIVFTFKFAEEISVFLRNARLFKAGPIELQSQAQIETSVKTQKSSRKPGSTLIKKGVTLTEEQIRQLENKFSKLTQETSSKEEQIKNKDQFINYLLYRSELYEFMYLNLYLVQNTKIVLLWFNSQPVTKEYFDLSFQTAITNSLEKEAIFNVLLNNQLVQAVSGTFRITEKGVRFLKFSELVK